jgi:hypothetical protein
MVQVDVFWSYALGAGFAIAHAHQLDAERKAGRSAFDHRSFRDTILFLACIFVPSGAYLVWAFPSWETMHVGDKDMPAWLITAFSLTNVTQGLLGFAVVNWLLARGKEYLAYLQWVLGYFAMFFILVHGWDGTGYIRFFSETKEQIPSWTWSTAGEWVACPVAIALYVMGVFLMPAMLHLMGSGVEKGLALAGYEPKSRHLVSFSVVAMSLTGVLGSAILASVSIRVLGPWLGVPAFAVIAYAVALRRGGIFYRHFRQLVYGESFLGFAVRSAGDERARQARSPV